MWINSAMGRVVFLYFLFAALNWNWNGCLCAFRSRRKVSEVSTQKGFCSALNYLDDIYLNCFRFWTADDQMLFRWLFSDDTSLTLGSQQLVVVFTELTKYLHLICHRFFLSLKKIIKYGTYPDNKVLQVNSVDTAKVRQESQTVTTMLDLFLWHTAWFCFKCIFWNCGPKTQHWFHLHNICRCTLGERDSGLQLYFVVQKHGEIVITSSAATCWEFVFTLTAVILAASFSSFCLVFSSI